MHDAPIAAFLAKKAIEPLPYPQVGTLTEPPGALKPVTFPYPDHHWEEARQAGDILSPLGKLASLCRHRRLPPMEAVEGFVAFWFAATVNPLPMPLAQERARRRDAGGSIPPLRHPADQQLRFAICVDSHGRLHEHHARSDGTTIRQGVRANRSQGRVETWLAEIARYASTSQAGPTEL
ncbi:hypothetical protein [Streptomyces sp. NPDC059278]|uniref:hypothetical protein n=1 Tax=Streptomyces sp. NPDC059278 TaxID=3346801 RepID=UPI0036CCDCFF